MVHRTQPPMWGPLLLYTCLTPFSLSSLYMHLLSHACFSFRHWRIYNEWIHCLPKRFCIKPFIPRVRPWGSVWKRCQLIVQHRLWKGLQGKTPGRLLLWMPGEIKCLTMFSCPRSQYCKKWRESMWVLFTSQVRRTIQRRQEEALAYLPQQQPGHRDINGIIGRVEIYFENPNNISNNWIRNIMLPSGCWWRLPSMLSWISWLKTNAFVYKHEQSIALKWCENVQKTLK